jgi:signal peptidase II
MTGPAQHFGLACIAAAFVTDQASKAIVITFAADLRNGIELLPFFNLVLIHNRGASFGLFSELPWWTLVVLGLIVTAILSAWLWRAQSRMLGAALGLAIGGALGNVLDRAWRRAVPDFLDFHIGAYHWPAFNLADVAIVSGLGLLIARGTKQQTA